MNEMVSRLFQFFPVIGLMVGCFFVTHRALHYFQLESYQFQGYFKTLNRQAKKVFFPCFIYSVLSLVLFLGYQMLFALRGIGYNIIPSEVSFSHLIPQILLSVGFSVLLAVAGYMILKVCYHTAEKKPFVKTARIKRLYCFLALFLSVFSILLFHISLLYVAVLPFVLPFIIALSAVFALPVEKGIQRMYFKDAQKKLLSNPRLIRIGITGSYGKTSTKFVLSHLLEQKYNVLKTPMSFNTPMGLTRVIRERLNTSHQVFIGEMGARHVGEIKELCTLVHPQIGILTSVGPQHLDTFYTLDRIKKTKYELIESIGENGLCVFLNDDGIVTQMYQNTNKNKLLVGAIQSDAWAEDVQVSSQGSTFTLCLKGEEKVQVTTKLLGKHNISNILVSCAVSKYLGLSMRQIVLGISSLEPVEHRMKIVSTSNQITVIDDAFNTNPHSSKEALNILSAFQGRRVIVTPGMVELGKDEDMYNNQFGQHMADCVDIVVLVGKKHTEPILKGLLEKGFLESNVHVFDALSEAVQFIHSISQAGDVILYENDLPDHYA